MSNTARVPVLMYHRVGPAHNAWEARYAITPETFAQHMQALRRARHHAVTVDALVDWLEGGPSLPPGAIVVTFDDGFRGVHDHALPVMESLGWPFTVFLVADLIGRDDAWTRHENPAGVTYPLLDADEIADMQRRGVAFHSHTLNHPSLPTLDDAALAEQLGGSRVRLSQLLGREVRYLAYPFGHVDDRVEAATRAAGYRAAFSTRSGFNRRDVERFRIRRLDVYGTDTVAMLLRKVRFGSNDGSLTQAATYYVSRVTSRFAGARR
jgi:peptidoglycan/xylan/chitin deacetylase (PgdA/CDA1 family)